MCKGRRRALVHRFCGLNIGKGHRGSTMCLPKICQLQRFTSWRWLSVQDLSPEKSCSVLRSGIRTQEPGAWDSEHSDFCARQIPNSYHSEVWSPHIQPRRRPTRWGGLLTCSTQCGFHRSEIPVLTASAEVDLLTPMALGSTPSHTASQSLKHTCSSTQGGRCLKTSLVNWGVATIQYCVCCSQRTSWLSNPAVGNAVHHHCSYSRSARQVLQSHWLYSPGFTCQSFRIGRLIPLTPSPRSPRPQHLPSGNHQSSFIFWESVSGLCPFIHISEIKCHLTSSRCIQSQDLAMPHPSYTFCWLQANRSQAQIQESPWLEILSLKGRIFLNLWLLISKLS